MKSKERELIESVARNVITHAQVHDWGIDQWARASHYQREQFVRWVGGTPDNEVMYWTLREWRRQVAAFMETAMRSVRVTYDDEVRGADGRPLEE